MLNAKSSTTQAVDAPAPVLARRCHSMSSSSVHSGFTCDHIVAYVIAVEEFVVAVV